jgi:hypothetical protein
LDEIFVKINGKLCYLWRRHGSNAGALRAGNAAGTASALVWGAAHVANFFL